MIKTLYFPARSRTRMLEGGPRTKVRGYTHSLVDAGRNSDFLPRNVQRLRTCSRRKLEPTLPEIFTARHNLALAYLRARGEQYIRRD